MARQAPVAGVGAPEPAELRQLRAIVLALMAPTQSAAPSLAQSGVQSGALRQLGAADWAAIDRMAAQHRLQPLLHAARGTDPDIPPDVRAGWQAAHRAAAVGSLVLEAELRDTMRLLGDAGLAPIALKGAWLAWHAYPHPALRPMRDLDILLAPETVIAGYELLRRHDYRCDDAAELPLDEIVRLDKHLPPLLSPRGITIELHQRLWEIAGRTDHAAPGQDGAAIRSRAIQDGAPDRELAFLAPQDLLAHLTIHAIYDHRLDCGPLVLTDIAFLLHRSAIDWPRFWADAAAGGWERGARLLLQLVHEFDPAAPVWLPPAAPPLPEDFSGLAADLLLQDLTTRQSAGVVATLAAAGPKALFLRLFARRKAAGDMHSVPRNLAGKGGFAGWAGSRLVRTALELTHADVRRQSAGLARLSRWLNVQRQ